MTGTEGYWGADAACGSVDADELFAKSAQQKRAATVCNGCPVRIDCLIDALDNRVEFGVWGGKTERERRKLHRSRPDITSWRPVLEEAERRADEQPRAC